LIEAFCEKYFGLAFSIAVLKPLYPHVAMSERFNKTSDANQSTGNFIIIGSTLSLTVWLIAKYSASTPDTYSSIFSQHIGHIQLTYSASAPDTYSYIFSQHTRHIQLHIQTAHTTNIATYSASTPYTYTYTFNQHTQSK